MARSATTQHRPTLTTPRLEEAPNSGALVPYAFDVDAYHAMEKRDAALIQDEILHGRGSSAFVYSFPIAGSTTPATGVSVVGARHLAAHCGGIQHRIVASVEKRGAQFIFRSYPAENVPMQVNVNIIDELEAEPDYYSVVVETRDIKTGNTVQMEASELRWEQRRDKSWYERPNFQKIAQAKAYRNAVLALIPQDLVIQWKLEMLSLEKKEVITASVIDEKRTAVLQFAAGKGLSLDRKAVENLTLEQIAGLGDAAREGALPAFVQSAQALGLMGDGMVDQASTRPQRQDDRAAAQETGRTGPNQNPPIKEPTEVPAKPAESKAPAAPPPPTTDDKPPPAQERSSAPQQPLFEC